MHRDVVTGTKAGVGGRVPPEIDQGQRSLRDSAGGSLELQGLEGTQRLQPVGTEETAPSATVQAPIWSCRGEEPLSR